MEEIRAQIAELLGVDAGGIDPGADLVAQGLDSIRMMALAGRWRKRGIDVDFARLAADPRIDAWSELLGGASAWAAVDAPSPVEADPDAPFPLAPMQHAMWVGRADDQPLGGVAGHLYVEFDGTGVDPGRLADAATALAGRHPMLRVRFLPDGTQRIDPAGTLKLVVTDLRDHAAHVVADRLAEIRQAKSHQQLDGAVLELTLTRLPGERSRLHVDLDMQAADAMSYRTLMADLAALYHGTRLPDLGYSYAEYRQQAEARTINVAHRDWWADRIPELPDPPRLPASDRPGRTSSRRWHWLDPAARDALFAGAHARGVTPAMALAAAFAHTLARWSADERFLLNVPLFGRDPLHPDVDRLVGDFTSSLLLDVDLTGTATAAQRARAVQDGLRAAAAHSDYPGLSVLRDLGRHRGTPVLAPVVFTSALGLGELFSADVTDTFGTPCWIISQGPQVLLDAQVTEFDGGVLVNWDVRDDAFPPGVIDAMFDHHVAELTRLAGGVWEAPDVAALPAGQAAVRAAVNARVAKPSGETLQHGFFRRAAESPDAPAVYAATGNLTYAQVREQALTVAAALRDRGVRPGDIVALVGPKSAGQIPALLGILAAGGAYLPIGTDQPPDRVARMLAVGQPVAALATGDEIPRLPVPVLTVREAMLGDAGGFDPASVATDPDALAYVLFTSGSTGDPKGVEVTHDAVLNTVEFLSGHFGFAPSDRSLALLTLEADMSVLDVFAMLRAGGAIVLVDEADRRDPDTWARLIREHRVSVLNLMPGSLEMLSGNGPLPSVRAVLTGGDWVRPGLVGRMRAAAPGVRFAGLGGATETAIHATLCEVGETGPPAHWSSVPYGVPFPNMACRVVDATGADRPDWVPGELWVSGRGIARGYRGRPDLTAEKFVADGRRTWYRTGDLARYWPDGTCEFVGRADHRVKISGYRVELGDVQAALRQVQGVLDAVAVVLPGPGDGVLGAVVRTGTDPLDDRGIADALADLVPAHMIPRRLAVVDEIPYTLSGKIDRRAVGALLAAAAGEGPGRREPTTPLQHALAGIIAEVLGAGPVGADDDFFALGGDSVLATAAIARIRNWLDVPDATVPDMFAGRTVAALAERLAAHEPDPRRLEAVAEVYLEVAQMDSAQVLAAVAAE